MSDPMTSFDRLLPDGRHLALAWTIPDRIGGLTSAMLHRSRMFVRLGGAAVDVLTFDARPDYPAVDARLRAAGELVDGMRVINLWDWLRVHDVRRGSDPLGTPARAFTPLAADPSYRSARRDGVELSRVRFGADGRTELQVDHYRDDGSLLASDRRDTRVAGVAGGRSIVLCDRDGRPVRSWGRMWSLYRFWLDRLTRGGVCFLIADGKPVSRFLRTYRRPDRVTVHVAHGSHLIWNLGPWGPLRPSRAEVFRNLPDFDAVVLLTERHRRDTRLRFGDTGNLCVIPHSRPLPELSDAAFDRPAGAGVVLAALTRLKRVDHAVQAIALAGRRRPEVRLDVFGDGPRRRSLQRLAAAVAPGSVRLHGYDRSARDRLRAASFLLMTSTSEGFGLVILEAMAAGCIPIAYDIRYGPSDLIEHGRTGFLVRNRSIRSLARAIVHLQQMSPDDVRELRMRARRTAERFADEAVLPAWGRELRAALERNRVATAVGNPTGHPLPG